MLYHTGMTLLAQIERIRADAFTLIHTGQTTETALAFKAGISQPHLSAFISNRRSLSPATADALRQAILDVSFPLAA